MSNYWLVRWLVLCLDNFRIIYVSTLNIRDDYARATWIWIISINKYFVKGWKHQWRDLIKSTFINFAYHIIYPATLCENTAALNSDKVISLSRFSSFKLTPLSSCCSCCDVVVVVVVAVDCVVVDVVVVAAATAVVDHDDVVDGDDDDDVVVLLIMILLPLLLVLLFLLSVVYVCTV